LNGPTLFPITIQEILGGGASIAEWLCRQVGSSGHVVATDLEPRYLEAIDASNLEVWRHDPAHRFQNGSPIRMARNSPLAAEELPLHVVEQLQQIAGLLFELPLIGFDRRP
jgi:hypothetical protein